MTDYLAGLPEPRVAAWYRRLAGKIAQTRVADQEPLAALFLRHYLDNRDPASTFQFQAPVCVAGPRRSRPRAPAVRQHTGAHITLPPLARSRRAGVEGCADVPVHRHLPGRNAA